MKHLKLLVYGDVNLNIMDGSSVWLAELLRLLASDPRVELDFLHKAPDQGGPLNEQVRAIPGINRIEKHPRPMKPEQVVEAIRSLDAEHRYDRVFVRGNIAMGKELIKLLPGRLAYYTLEPFQRLGELTGQEKAEIGEMLSRTAFAVVQSERMRTSYSREFGIPEEHLYILPPLIPPILKNPGFRNRLNSLCYTGKFSEEWGTPGLVDTFKRLKELLPYAKLNIAGNKFHGDLGGRKNDIETFFANDESVNWVGVVSRQESIQLSRNSDIGFALRSNLIDNDDSQELSTKLFEYMSAGKPVILRATKVHRALMGEDYPLFAETPEQAAEKCAKALTDVALYSQAARMSYDAYKRFAKTVNHGGIVERLLQGQKTTILFAGHDLKFLTDTINAYQEDDNFQVLIDQWQGHTKHDETESLAKLEQADIIFCEWGLGNIRWYSHHKKAGQRLVVRIHLQENSQPQYLKEADREKIDRYIFIAPYRYEEFVEMHDLPRERAKLVFNTVHVEKFNLPKHPEAQYTLGFVGIVPWRKRFDKALELFDKLWHKDHRYTLRVKGKLPEDFPWMKTNPNFREELALYDGLYKKIKQAPWCNNVFFDGHGNDMPKWYRKIGYIVSTSDFEGSHQAVAEGMASGAIPLMLPWAGAETVYPKEFVFSDVEEMVGFVMEKELEVDNTSYAYEHFYHEAIVRQLRTQCEMMV
ncbi:glycosyltransferase [Halomonas lysinitropha]|uniref:Glycosyl transferases group 1 n=1 Tax=Halomonas lysinitropha TaxID=2607506 RepID=A0A5K1I646_9GAMM|nr:glycosyltransferase [Halomonas lysinitropha]VVZ95523.1 Glycosyl transferases group 1 [Halomonas lysinitropha]